LREASWVALQAYWLLIVWFWSARTRTVPWRLVAGLYSAGLVWAIGVAFGTHALAAGATASGVGAVIVPGGVDALGPSTMIAGIGEECAKLLPLVFLAVWAPGRVRRFAVVDWLLVGFASGLGFQVAEELARRTSVHVVRPGILDVLLGRVSDRGPGSGFAQYGWSPLGGWSQWYPGTQFPGHHAVTALVAVTVGLGIAAWRHAGTRPTRPTRNRLRWRVTGAAAPVVMLWLVISVHAGGNATAAVGERWVTAQHPSMPWLIRAGWQIGLPGVGLRWLLPALLVFALVIDARRLARGDETPAGPVLAAPFPPARRAQSWAASLLPEPAGLRDSAGGGPASRSGIWWRAGAGSVLLLVAYAWRDFVVLLVAHVPGQGQGRRAALVRARTAMDLLGRVRAEGLARSLGPSRSVDRARIRLTALTTAGLLLTAVFWLAPLWAYRIGTSPEVTALAHLPTDHAPWFARLLDALGHWWHGLSSIEKIAVGAGIAALVTLSGGSLLGALGVAGAGTYLFDHAQGAAAFIRDPGRATRSYLTHTTPLGVLADGAEAVLTFLPGNFAGGLAGRHVSALLAERQALNVLVGARIRDLATLVPGGSGEAALHLGSADPAVLKSVFRHEYSAVADVNAGNFARIVPGHSMNCTQCVIATDRTLAGTPSTAAPVYTNGASPRVVSQALGGLLKPVEDYGAIVLTMQTDG
jgi:hypothetical protein